MPVDGVFQENAGHKPEVRSVVVTATTSAIVKIARQTDEPASDVVFTAVSHPKTTSRVRAGVKVPWSVPCVAH